MGELEEAWQKQHEKDERVSKIYHNEHDLDLPNSKDQIIQPYEVRLGRGPELCDHVIGILNVEPLYSIDAAGKRAEDAEKWANLARATAEREQGEDTNTRMTGEAVMPGWSMVKILPNPQYWKNVYPKQGKDRDGQEIEDETDGAYNKRQKDFLEMAPFPVSIWHVSSRTGFPLLNGRNVMHLLEIKQVTLTYIEARYGDKLRDVKDQMRQIAKEWKLVEYTGPTHCGYYVFGPAGSDFKRELRTWEHRMPMPDGQAPVVLVEGFTSADTTPGRRYKSLIEDVRGALVGTDIIASRLISAVVTFFSLTIIHTIKQGAQYGETDIETLKNIRAFAIGGTNFKLPNEEIDVMAAPANLPDAESAFVKLDERINRALPPILSGDIQGVSSGYQFDVSRRTALTRVRPLGQRLAQADADIMRMIFYALAGLSKILKKDNLKVYVREASKEGVRPIGVSWEDVRDLIPLVRARRDEDFPEDVHSKIDAAIKAWKDLGLPWAYVIEKIFGAENPEELKELRDIENIVDSPTILERTEQDVFAEMELILNEQEGLPPEELLDPNAPPLPPGLEAALGLPGALPPPPPLALPGMPPGPLGPPMGMPPPPPMAPPSPMAGPNGSNQALTRTNPRAGTRTRNRGRRRKAQSATPTAESS